MRQNSEIKFTDEQMARLQKIIDNTVDNKLKSVLANLENCTDSLTPLLNDEQETHENIMSGQEDGMKRIKQRVIVGADSNGNQIVKWATGTTTQEVLEEAARILVEYGKIGPAKRACDASPFFNDFAEEWFKTIRCPRVKEQRRLEGRGILENYILPYFKGKRLNEIKPKDIAAYFLQPCIQDNLATSTAGNHGEMLNMIFKWAIQNEVMDKNPADFYKDYLPKRKVEREALLPEEIRDIISHLTDLEDEDRLLLSLYIFTGIRRGEALALQGGDIKGRSLTVRKGLTFHNNKPVIDAPKTKNSVRTIPILDGFPFELVEGIPEDAFLLGGDEPWTEKKYKRTMERIAKTIDLHGATAHVFRHTYITMAIASGIDPKTAQGLAGHSTPNTTMGIYAHVVQNSVLTAGSKLNGMYGARVTKCVTPLGA